MSVEFSNRSKHFSHPHKSSLPCSYQPACQNAVTYLNLKLLGPRLCWQPTKVRDRQYALSGLLTSIWRLSFYCNDDTIDIIPLAFLYIFFGKGGQPVVDFANVNF